MSESFCRVGDIDLCYETFGDSADPAVLLIMGLGTQMLGWDEEFCTELAGRGFFVVRYDNRDIGHSTILADAPVPTLGQILRRDKRAASYTLAEMAADGVGLLDHLGIERAHVVGASMGGMIAQTIAARRPERVLSLVSIMSSTGSRWRGQPALRTYSKFLRPMSGDRQGYIDQAADLFAWIGSPGFDRDEPRLRDLLGRMYDRSHDAGSSARQLAAILASGNRTRRLRAITAPTLVIHGDRDPLIPLVGGRATAKAIPGAKLMIVPGMGHGLPERLWPLLVDAVAEHVAAAERARAATQPATRS
jgi:pimeloyl-ACP methyl ester carboxylesterase